MKRVALNAMVKAAHISSNGSAGARSIAHIATRRGSSLSRYCATGFMQHLDLASTQLRSPRYKKITQPHIEIPNTLDRGFTPTRPNQVWCRDVTTIWTGRHWSYLAVVLELYAGVPVGWALYNSPSNALTATVLTMAYEHASDLTRCFSF